MGGRGPFHIRTAGLRRKVRVPLLPAAMLSSPWLAGSHLALFGAGTMLSMGAYALGVGLLFQRAGMGAPGLARIMRVGAGAMSGAAGWLWIVRAVS